MRSKLRRLARLQESVQPYLQQRKDEVEEAQKILVELARRHATCLAVLVLHGKPKLKEPLEIAWERCWPDFHIARFIGARCNDIWENRPDLVFREIFDELPGETETQKFQHVFDIAPAWLLKFTWSKITAGILELKCPDLSGAPREGRTASNQIFRWPLLPHGTLQGGGPVRPFREEKLTEEERRELYETTADLIDEVYTDCLNEGEMPSFNPRAERRKLKSLMTTGDKALKSRRATTRKR